MIVDISLDCVGSQRPLCSTLVRLPRPLSLMVPYSRRVMIVLRRSPYGVVSEGHVSGLFVRLPPAVLVGFTQEANISVEVAVGQIVFLSAVFFGFHSQYQNSLFSVPTSIRPMWPQGLILTLCFLTLSDGSFPGPHTQCGIGVPVKRLMLPGGVFLDALLY